jgi:hypothetical protein
MENQMTEFDKEVTDRLLKRFPNAVVKYNHDGYWDVRYSDGHTTYVDSYRFIYAKLVCFATLEMED